MDEHPRRFVVKPAADGRWTFGRADAVFQIFDSKQAAVSAAERFILAHPDVELETRDDPAPSDQPVRRRPAREKREQAPSPASTGGHGLPEGEPPATGCEPSAAKAGKDVAWDGAI